MFAAPPVMAASCCGGGGGGTLILAKNHNEMVGVTSEYEHYDGLWRADGRWVADPAGSDLNQYRVNFGYARRLSENWQGAVSLPYIFNRNRYSQFSRNSDGLGDTTVSAAFETFDAVTCVYRVESWEDVRPAIYLGGALTLPTGVSPYDDVTDNFDLTGRGFYRLDATMTIEKTIYPWTASFEYVYGTHAARPVNREYGRFVAPYTKRLGDRSSATLSLGYTLFTDSLATWTITAGYSEMREGEATVNGVGDATTGVRRRGYSLTAAWSDAAKEWTTKISFSRAPREDGAGRNFPTTDIVSLGVNRALR